MRQKIKGMLVCCMLMGLCLLPVGMAERRRCLLGKTNTLKYFKGEEER